MHVFVHAKSIQLEMLSREMPPGLPVQEESEARALGQGTGMEGGWREGRGHGREHQ